ncbi:MAG: 30S ribosomal protein S9 [Candidatus Spechtbacteria bacterium RIFCSPLOWO2_01_FULL_46_10]|uniref:Small ribosomal subunit protein uS9 n=1 Tax=Candidatus Spechtbacteria bacterium RIFCSPLOWO2_01_FULL_46_10 TaxID=1802163 RepID=A0A1G2HHR1_9BACT|nr:MAG: 30S ribosomal protein S9 [Candidatus Spechtbacteria bacterium RIFCSPLOWO2_01_FULL_46_10]
MKKTAAKKTEEKVSKYYEATGRRKTAIARVRLYADQKKTLVVNNKDYMQYFGTEELQTAANAPLRKVKLMEVFSATVKVLGGGPRAQAEAMRHGIARALVKYDPELRLRLKKSGYLKRDPREKERKKPGLKGARRAPQWSKR